MIYMFYLIYLLYIIYFILHKYFKKHFWYNVYKKLNNDKSSYYTDQKLNEIIIEKNINNLNLNNITNLYKSYFPSSFKITHTTFKNLYRMENPAFIYKNESNTIIAGVFNSINDIIYKNKICKANFIDYAVVHYEKRHQNIFQSLMNSIAKYTNENNTKYIIFKIDMNPIPSFQYYNFKSNYYYLKKNKINYQETLLTIEKKDNYEDYYNKINNSLSKLKIYPKLSKNTTFANILKNNDTYITIIIDNNIIMNFKRHSPEHIELLYILKTGLNNNEQLLSSYKAGLLFIKKTEIFDRITVDSIGFNLSIIELFEYSHKTYHYTLGINETFNESEYYYYF